MIAAIAITIIIIVGAAGCLAPFAKIAAERIGLMGRKKERDWNAEHESMIKAEEQTRDEVERIIRDHEHLILESNAQIKSSTVVIKNGKTRIAELDALIKKLKTPPADDEVTRITSEAVGRIIARRSTEEVKS